MLQCDALVQSARGQHSAAQEPELAALEQFFESVPRQVLVMAHLDQYQILRVIR